MHQLSAKGILIGGLTDVVLSGILGIPLTIYVIASRNLSLLNRERMQAAVIAAVHESVALHSVQLLIGVSCSVLGGYVAGRIAKRSELLNGMLASWLCVGIGVYYLALGKSSEPWGLHMLLIGVTPLCYLLGAYLERAGRSHEHSPA